MLPALEERLEQAKQGALPIGHAMELRRREKRQAMGCPSDEEICGFVDGELRGYSAKRWAEVRWHVRQCQPCQDDVEGLCEMLELDPNDVSAAHKPVRQRLSRFVAPLAAVAAVLALVLFGVQTYVPTLAGGLMGLQDITHVDAPVQTPALIDHQQTMQQKGFVQRDSSTMQQKGFVQRDSSTMKVSIPSAPGSQVSPVLRVAICSETERPTCGVGMTLMSVVGAECEVTADENSCFAKSAAGGCAICLMSK
ncbi:MAG: hypothetical protein ETSY1_00360 [Candidatus Entotheonella factor]|uniref:Zinc-finger domain-containing protein n=1 Tax=Entotheonella factor TaxID=1429438 RepID=W4M050_ENTF1|nr:MAG: hypothetical protein ETSY1_00360 [Candidatus Entotheonella factor]